MLSDREWMNVMTRDVMGGAGPIERGFFGGRGGAKITLKSSFQEKNNERLSVISEAISIN